MFEFFVATFFGLLFGNYLTTLYSRIKQKEPINGSASYGIPPHCDSCKHELRYYEYFPVLSWYYSRFKCNYCGINIPKIYLGLELSGLFLSLFCCYLFGISNLFILSFFSTLLLLLILVLWIY